MRGGAGDKEVALRDAAKAAILLEPQKKQPEGRAKLGKALFRKGSAHAAKGTRDSAAMSAITPKAHNHNWQIHTH